MGCGALTFFSVNFLCRSNIGNAKTFGLLTDLHVSNELYPHALAAFYCAYHHHHVRDRAN